MTILGKSSIAQSEVNPLTSKECELSVSTSEAAYPNLEKQECSKEEQNPLCPSPKPVVLQVNVTNPNCGEKQETSKYRYRYFRSSTFRSKQKRCCLCFDLRTGVILISIILLLDGIFGIISNTIYSVRGYNSNAMGSPIGSEGLFWFFVFCIAEMVAAIFGIFGGCKKNIGAIYLFLGYALLMTIFLLVFCILHFTYKNWVWAHIYLGCLLVWLYWSMQIWKYYKLLKYDNNNLELQPSQMMDRPTRRQM
jgi:hypothetical protein